MKFINEGKDVQVRIPEGPNRYRWNGVRTGEEIDLPESIGLVYGFKKVGDVKLKVTEGKIGKTIVETKQIDIDKNTDDYSKKLNDIGGIGEKTANDIIRVFQTEEKLKIAIKNYDKLPFRDDIEKKLREEYE